MFSISIGQKTSLSILSINSHVGYGGWIYWRFMSLVQDLKHYVRNFNLVGY